jgi:glyoxylase-like metal-dependent hydrolase (beta-lactamase superfamily II)
MRLLALALAGLGVVGLQAQPKPRVAATTVVPGVYVIGRTAPPGLILDSNTVAIVNADDVVIVDTNATLSSARATLAVVRDITPKPVTAVINTHWHDDHIVGNQVYREAFPDAEFIAHAAVPGLLAQAGAEARRVFLERAPRMLAELHVALDQQKSLAGGAASDEERESYQHDCWILERLSAELPGAITVLPTRTVSDRLVLTRGARRIEIRALGHGHSPSDLIVHLPRERVVMAGDLVSWPAPLVGASSQPKTYRAALDALAALRPTAIVPGHGPVIRDGAYLQRTARLLEALAAQVSASVGRGEAIDETRRAVRLDNFRHEFAGDSRLFGFLFENYVLSSGIPAAYREARK